MKVNSPLANMQMYVGSVVKDGRQLIIRSDEGSTMAADVYVAPEDAWDFLKAVIRSPAALLYVLAMPLIGAFGNGSSLQSTADHSTLNDELNKPW